MKDQTISFYTLGCRLNQAETALIEESFVQKGYQVVPFGRESDLCVINSCTVTESGDADCRKTVRKFKRFNPQGKVAVVGCYSQVAAEEVGKIPGVNLVVGNRQKMKLAEVMDHIHLPEDRPIILKESLGKLDSFTIDISGSRQKTVRANLKIQDGCDFFCSYCVIPFARGRAHSRQFHDLIREANELVNSGHQEIVLTGINVGTYRYGEKTFLDVVRSLEKINGLKRIRVSSIEPTTVDEPFLKYMADSEKLCSYLHLPLQSGSNPVLKKMKRKYSAGQYLDDVNLAFKLVPGIAIGTDIIVGFPGETEEMFRESFQFVKDISFAYFHVFSYSDRSLAKASRYPDKVSQEVIRERSSVMRELGKRKKELHYSRLIGKTTRVLFEQKKGEWWSGHDERFILVKTKSEENLKNSFRNTRILNFEDEKAIGSLV